MKMLSELRRLPHSLSSTYTSLCYSTQAKAAVAVRGGGYLKRTVKWHTTGRNVFYGWVEINLFFLSKGNGGGVLFIFVGWL